MDERTTRGQEGTEMKFNTILKQLTESPYVGDEEKMEQKKISTISILQLRRAWKSFKKFDDGFEIYQIKTGYGFIGGRIINNNFSIYVDLQVESPYKNAPLFLKNSIQVELVMASPNSEERGFAKRVYHEVAKKYTLISDKEQYIASMRLWKSLARENDIFVYIWEDFNGSFIMENSKPKRYNGINIEHDRIFGKESKHYKIVLVALNKELET